MKPMLNLLKVSLFAFGLGSSAHAADLSEILSSGVVKIAVPESFAPFGSIGAGGEHEGYDVDVAKLNAKDLGVKLEVFAPSTTDISSPVDLSGMTVGVTGGSLEDLEITDAAPDDAKIVRFGDNAATLSAFTSGQVQVLVTGNTAAASLTDADPSLDLERKYIIKDSPCFIGVKKGNEDLLRWVNVFILHKKLGGELNAISQKWLGQNLPPLPSL